jgi:ADP-ribosylglycohydrolase
MANREALLDSLEGLCTGDAFGQQMSWRTEEIAKRRPGVPIWHWTDDSEMAFSLSRNLLKQGRVDQDSLALSFAHRFDPTRLYGAAMLFDLLPKLKRGAPWRTAAGELFDGQGSYGNGAAMRVAPLGAFFADDLERVVSQAQASAEVTHAHSEAIAGAIAVAVASALAFRQRKARTVTGSRTFLEQIIPHVPASQVRDGLQLAYEAFGPRTSIFQIAERLGNGSHVTAQDTVPLCLWIAGAHLHDFEEALWTTVAQLGDMDTNCAIVGGIVAANVGRQRIPADWLRSRESIPHWATAVDDVAN